MSYPPFTFLGRGLGKALYDPSYGGTLFPLVFGIIVLLDPYYFIIGFQAVCIRLSTQMVLMIPDSLTRLAGVNLFQNVKRKRKKTTVLHWGWNGEKVKEKPGISHQVVFKVRVQSQLNRKNSLSLVYLTLRDHFVQFCHFFQITNVLLLIAFISARMLIFGLLKKNLISAISTALLHTITLSAPTGDPQHKHLHIKNCCKNIIDQYFVCFFLQKYISAVLKTN